MARRNTSDEFEFIEEAFDEVALLVKARAGPGGFFASCTRGNVRPSALLPDYVAQPIGETEQNKTAIVSDMFLVQTVSYAPGRSDLFGGTPTSKGSRSSCFRGEQLSAFIQDRSDSE